MKLRVYPKEYFLISLILLSLFEPVIAVGDIYDSFEDGDYTANPAWYTQKYGTGIMQVNNTHGYDGTKSVNSTGGTRLITNVTNNLTTFDFWLKAVTNTAGTGNIGIFITNNSKTLTNQVRIFWGNTGGQEGIDSWAGQTVQNFTPANVAPTANVWYNFKIQQYTSGNNSLRLTVANESGYIFNITTVSIPAR